MASWSDASSVCRPYSRARSWSIETSATGAVSPATPAAPVRNVVAAPAWAGVQYPRRPETTVSWSLNGSSGWRIGVSSNPRPSSAGVQYSIAMPLGT